MERKDLVGYRFEGGSDDLYQVIAGYQHSEVVYEKLGNNEPLFFCCDAEIVSGKLKGSYCVSYSVTKEEFFAEIESLSGECKTDADTMASELKEKYYKIPIVFLKIVGIMWLKENTNSLHKRLLAT